MYMLGLSSCFLWFIYLPGYECCEQTQSENFELRYRNSREVQELHIRMLYYI